MFLKTDKILLDIYRELYFNSEPSVNFDKLMEEAGLNELGQKEIPFNDYQIEEDKFKEILEKHLKSKRLTKLTKQAIRNSVYLGASPKFK